MLGPAELVFRTRMPPTSTVISGAVRVSNCALSIKQFFGRNGVSALEVIAEAIGDRLEDREGFDIGLLLRSVHASRRERHLTSWPAFFAACSTAAHPPARSGLRAKLSCRQLRTD